MSVEDMSDKELSESKKLVKVEKITSNSKEVDTVVKVISKSEVRNVTSGGRLESHQVCDALVGDETGSIYLTLWDDNINKINEEATLRITNGYVNQVRGNMRLNIGRYGSFQLLEESSITEVNTENNLSDKRYEQERRYQPYRQSGYGGSRYGERRGYQRRRVSYGGSREMHEAVCADCGKDCEVPFIPTQSRPVYCRDCFEKRRRPRY
jgi:replication factor A1